MKFRFSEPELLLAANSQRIGMRLAVDQEDFKQSLAKLVLRSVQVRDGAIIVEVGL